MRINLYGCCFSIGVMAFHFIFKHYFLNKMVHITTEDWSYICTIGVISSIIGGRIMKYVKGYFSLNKLHQIYKGGLVSYGAFYVGLIYCWFIAKIYNESEILFIESVILSKTVIHGTIRLGNYFNNELGGRYIHLINRIYPLQIHRVITEGFIMGGILWYHVDTIGTGKIYLLFANVYPLIRIFNELFTNDDLVMPNWYKKYCYKYLSYPNFQALSLCLFFNLFYLFLK